MKALRILPIVCLLLAACKSVPELYMTESAIVVEQAALTDYWVQKETEVSFSSRTLKPPKEDGFVAIKYLIDSNGAIFNPQIMESVPKGAWDKVALRALNAMEFVPAKDNTARTPVYVTMEFNFGAS